MVKSDEKAVFLAENCHGFGQKCWFYNYSDFSIFIHLCRENVFIQTEAPAIKPGSGRCLYSKDCEKKRPGFSRGVLESGRSVTAASVSSVFPHGGPPREVR